MTTSSSLLSDFSPQTTFSCPARNFGGYSTISSTLLLDILSCLHIFLKFINCKCIFTCLFAICSYLDEDESVKLGDGPDAVLHFVLSHLCVGLHCIVLHIALHFIALHIVYCILQIAHCRLHSADCTVHIALHSAQPFYKCISPSAVCCIVL